MEMDSGIPGPTVEPRRDEGMPTGAAPMEILTVLDFRQKNKHLKCKAKECTQKHSGLELPGQRSAEFPDGAARETLGPVKSHIRERKTHEYAWESSRKQHQWGSRDAEMLEIRTFDRLTRVQQIPTRKD